MTQFADAAEIKSNGATLRAFNRLEWTLLAIASIVCGFVGVGIGQMLGIPREPHLNGSLLLGGAPLVGAIAILIAILLLMAIGSLMASFVEREAGLFCCCLGLAALAVRCGSMRPVLQYAGSTTAFATLTAEAALLTAGLVGGWIGLQMLLTRTLSRRDAKIYVAPRELKDPTRQQKLSTLGVQMLLDGNRGADPDSDRRQGPGNGGRIRCCLRGLDRGISIHRRWRRESGTGPVRWGLP